MIRVQACLPFARRFSLLCNGLPSGYRLGFRSVTTGRQQHGAKSFDEIPGPRSFDSIVTFIQKGGMKNLYQIQRERFEKFGPIFKETTLGKTFVHIADSEATAVIAQTEGSFPSRKFLDCDVLHDTPMHDLFGNDYERWKVARSGIAPSFLRPKEVEKFAPGINNVATDAVKRLKRLMKDGKVAHLENEMNGFSTENILLLIFGERMGVYDVPQNPSVSKFMKATSDFAACVYDLALTPLPWRNWKVLTIKKMCQAKDQMYGFANEFAKMKIATERQQDDLRVSLFDKLPGKIDLVRSVAISLSQAGVETTSITFSWCLYHLSRNAEEQQKAYEEIVSVIGTATNDKSSEIFQFHSKLPYLKACVKEGMRLSPSVGMVQRTLEKDTTICGYNLPATTAVAIWSSTTSSSSEYFSKPEKFNPERWIRGEYQEKIHPYASIPFGYGVRMCLGRRFAELELVIGLARILQRFRLQYIGNESVRAVTMNGQSVPEKEIPIKFVERE